MKLVSTSFFRFLPLFVTSIVLRDSYILFWNVCKTDLKSRVCFFQQKVEGFFLFFLISFSLICGSQDLGHSPISCCRFRLADERLIITLTCCSPGTEGKIADRTICLSRHSALTHFAYRPFAYLTKCIFSICLQKICKLQI